MKFSRSDFLTVIVVLIVVLLLTGVNSFAKEHDKCESAKTGVERLTQANNEFGFSLLKRLKTGKNVFISPLSVHLALGMTYMGAEGETEREMRQTLYLPDLEKEEIAELYKKLLERFASFSEINLSIANSIWARKDTPFKGDFLDTGRKFFGAKLAKLAFDDPEALKKINGWVSEKTHGKISQIIDRLNPLDIMVLLNAIYFEGPWSDQFKEEATRERTFYLADGSEKEIPMMNQFGNFRYLETEKLQLIRLPYGDEERLAAYIALPGQEYGLQDFTAGLSVDRWKDLLSRMRHDRGRIALPRFELKYEKQLNDPLKQLGMKLPFNKRQADLTGIIDLLDKNAYISLVKHKTLLEVTEKGTVAAAATGVKIGVTSTVQTEQPFEMVVDRPFLFVIADEDTGSLLFLGEVWDPQRVS